MADETKLLKNKKIKHARTLWAAAFAEQFSFYNKKKQYWKQSLFSKEV